MSHIEVENDCVCKRFKRTILTNSRTVDEKTMIRNQPHLIQNIKRERSTNSKFNQMHTEHNQFILIIRSDIKMPAPLLVHLVNGVWGNWSSFSVCSKSCGRGTQIRQRECDSPSPAYGGAVCLGNINETRSCNTNVCPGMV